MIVGIMQPYFFPYFEHFRLINACDRWIVFDTSQYTRKSWISRNRVLNKERGWTYISVPVRRSGRDTSIRDATIDSGAPWRESVRNRLLVYSKRAPHYEAVARLVDRVLATDTAHVAELNVAGLREVCRYLGITTPIDIVSELDLDLPERAAPGDWALHVARSVGADEYRTPAGGTDLFDPDVYAAHGIELSFHEHRQIRYDTADLDFVPDLSVIDPMMWNHIGELTQWLASPAR